MENAVMMPPIIMIKQASTKPNRLPFLCISNDAGKVDNMVNKNKAAMGKVAQRALGDKASPTKPLPLINDALIDIPSA